MKILLRTVVTFLGGSHVCLEPLSSGKKLTKKMSHISSTFITNRTRTTEYNDQNDEDNHDYKKKSYDDTRHSH